MDFSFLPEIFSLTVLLVGFRPLVRRVGAHANVWFLGWGFVLLHQVAMFFAAPAGPRHLVMQVLAFWGYQLCGLSFLLAAARPIDANAMRVMVPELAGAMMLQSGLMVFSVRVPWLHHILGVLFLLPALHLLVWRRERTPPIVGVALAFACFGVFALGLESSHPQLVAGLALSLGFLAAAYVYALHSPVKSRGDIAVVVGLTVWGLSYPLLTSLQLYFPAIHLTRAMTEMPEYLVVAGIILTLLEEHLTRTERMAMHDPLTDLPNRRLFEERLIATMEEARNQRTTVACLVIDVDNFKTINDTLGHSAGDQLLRALAVRLSWHMSPRDILARTGGDEFTALLAGVNDEHHLRFIAGAMMSASSVPMSLDGQSVDVHISIGIALSPDHADDIDSLRRAADEAMYAAKRGGGGRLAFAGEDVPVRTVTRRH